MSAAARIPPIMKVLASIKYGELVADIVALAVRVEVRRKRGEVVVPKMLEDLLTLTQETAQLREDMKVDIEGFDFAKLQARVAEICKAG